MKKLIVFLLILSGLIGIVLFMIGISNLKNNVNDNPEDNLNINLDKTTGEVIKEDSESEGINENTVGSAGSNDNAGSSSPINPEIMPKRELPADLNTRPCGFYFTEYAVCAGACPAGQCLTDKKSCYCQIV